MMGNIVPLKGCHSRQIAEIEKQCFSDPWSENQVCGFLDNETSFSLVYEQDNTVIGYLTANIILDEMYIANIAVKKEYRNKGIGGAIINEVLREAKKRKLSFISLEVRCSNLAAIAFYKKHGFLKCGMRKGYYTKPTEDANIMTLYLTK